jgi:hypothetical protein
LAPDHIFHVDGAKLPRLDNGHIHDVPHDHHHLLRVTPKRIHRGL